jgi:hypothetical protein
MSVTALTLTANGGGEVVMSSMARSPQGKLPNSTKMIFTLRACDEAPLSRRRAIAHSTRPAEWRAAHSDRADRFEPLKSDLRQGRLDSQHNDLVLAQ